MSLNNTPDHTPATFNTTNPNPDTTPTITERNNRDLADPPPADVNHNPNHNSNTNPNPTTTKLTNHPNPTTTDDRSPTPADVACKRPHSNNQPTSIMKDAKRAFLGEKVLEPNQQ